MTRPATLPTMLSILSLSLLAFVLASSVEAAPKKAAAKPAAASKSGCVCGKDKGPCPMMGAKGAGGAGGEGGAMMECEHGHAPRKAEGDKTPPKAAPAADDHAAHHPAPPAPAAPKK